MLKLILALLPLAAATFGQVSQAKPAPEPAQSPTKTVPAKTTPATDIPAGAVKIDDITYRYQDKSGQVWLYRRTPFGVTKIEEKEADKVGLPAAPAVETPQGTATDLGDSYRFERPGPFGAKIWFKKKTELK